MVYKLFPMKMKQRGDVCIVIRVVNTFDKNIIKNRPLSVLVFKKSYFHDARILINPNHQTQSTTNVGMESLVFPFTMNVVAQIRSRLKKQSWAKEGLHRKKNRTRLTSAVDHVGVPLHQDLAAHLHVGKCQLVHQPTQARRTIAD